MCCGEIPVSYTHLDVYKRQVCVCVQSEPTILPYSSAKLLRTFSFVIFGLQKKNLPNFLVPRHAVLYLFLPKFLPKQISADLDVMAEKKNN